MFNDFDNVGDIVGEYDENPGNTICDVEDNGGDLFGDICVDTYGNNVGENM